MLFKHQFYHASTFLLSWGRCTFDSYFLSLPQHPICTTHQLGTQSKQKQQQELAAIHYNRIKTFLGTSASPSYHPWRPATTLLFHHRHHHWKWPHFTLKHHILKITAFESQATSQNCRRQRSWAAERWENYLANNTGQCLSFIPIKLTLAPVYKTRIALHTNYHGNHRNSTAIWLQGANYIL